MKSLIANKIWLFTQKSEYKRFKISCKSHEREQNEILTGYLLTNKNSDFGKKYGFDGIKNYKDYASRVPVQSWNDIERWVKQIKSGNQNVLTVEPVIGFQETSGTTSYSKLIPYTKLLKQEFEKGVASWLVSLSLSKPKVFSGCSYWSLSPATKKSWMTQGGLKVGIEDDKEYFNPLAAALLSNILAVPASLKNIQNSDEFYNKTLDYLLNRKDLSFISVWSPAFFLQLDGYLVKKLGKDFLWKDIWPNLVLLSCWTHAQSSLWIQGIQHRLGNVSIQGKGLLSTEGIVSIPIEEGNDPVLSFRSHFYEFKNLKTDKVYRSHEIKKDQIYEVILTTGGGLYRYASGDLIKVTGHYNSVPGFEFLGRNHNQSDLVGEKLSEIQVNQALARANREHSFNPALTFIYPTNSSNNLGYTLFIEDRDQSKEALSRYSSYVESEFCQNTYYEHAVRLGQLRKLNTIQLKKGFSLKLSDYLKNKSNIRDGDLKIPALFRRGELKELLGE